MFRRSFTTSPNKFLLQTTTKFSSLRFCSTTTTKQEQFPPLHKGSRRCTIDIEINNNNNSEKIKVDIFPVAHAATKQFYDKCLHQIDDLWKETYSDDDQSCGGELLNPRKFVTLVEGASETVAERKMEREELDLLQHHIRVDLKNHAEDSLKSNKTFSTQQVLESQQFLHKFQFLLENEKLYPPEQVQAICQMYQLPFPLPQSLLLQDVYFRPRLALLFGKHVMNGDVILEKIQNVQAVTSDPRAFHYSREANCVQSILDLAFGSFYKKNSEIFNKNENNNENQQKNLMIDVNDEVNNQAKRLVVLWGHYHSARLLHLLEQMEKIYASKNLNSENSSSSSCSFKILSKHWSDETIDYGWTRKMMKDIYNIDDSKIDDAPPSEHL